MRLNILLMIVCISILLVPTISASNYFTCLIYGNCKSVATTSSGISTYNSSYYLNSNPFNFLNITTLPSMNYTNLALTNQSNNFNGGINASNFTTSGFTINNKINGTGNITTTQYGFFGWLGSLTNYIGNMFVTNATITNLNVTNITMQTPQFVSIGNLPCYPLKCLSWCVNGSGTNTHTYYNGTSC